MKTLSIRQPWAWLIVNGYKDVENRDWPTRFRGPLFIHAGKTMTRADYQAALLFMASPEFYHIPLPQPKDLPLGGIVGEVEIADCVTASTSPWFCGPYGFVLRNARPLPFLAIDGRLGLFEIHAAKYYIPAATAAGWQISDAQNPDCPCCDHRNTNGLLDCPDCELPAAEFLDHARLFLRRLVGTTSTSSQIK